MLSNELVPEVRAAAELEKVRVVAGAESALALGVAAGTVIDPAEDPELFERHQAFAKEQMT